jgi:transcriptional regulator with XRE-family HTH domain
MVDTKKLQKILDEKGLNHKEMAKLCKISESQVCRTFKGQRNITIGTCKKIAKGLKLDPLAAYSIFFK